MKLHPRRIAPLVIVAFGAVGVSLLVVTRPEPAVKPQETTLPLVRVVRVEPEPVRLRVRTHGTVVPRTASDLVPQVSGEVVWVSPALVSGGFFEKGDVLVRLDPSDTEVELESARAAVARARSEAARKAKERDRQRALAEQSVTSQARIDDAENEHRVALAALREARARLERAERDLARTELAAPYDGRVREENVDLGQFVSRGASIARLYAVDFAEVRLPVPDRELAFLDLPLVFRGAEQGAAAEQPEVLLRAEFAGQEHEWRGRIVRTEGEIDPRSRMVNLVASVADPYHLHGEAEGRPPLAVGLFVEAEILGRRLERAFEVPRSALRDGDRLLVIDDEDRVRFRTVEVVRTLGEQVVVARGLEAGERVCVSPLRAAVEGMAVRVSESAEALAEAGP